MKKQFKKNDQVGIIELAKGYKLIVPRHSDNTQIMVAIGMLVQVWTLAEIENDKKIDIARFKEMINAYVDKITSEVIKANGK